LLCGITGFLAFSIFAPLKTVVTGNEDEFISLFFQGPGHVFIGGIVLLLSFYALALSVVSAALFKSLLPST